MKKIYIITLTTLLVFNTNKATAQVTEVIASNKRQVASNFLQKSRK